MPMSIEPLAMRPVMRWLACWADPHCESTVVAATSYGKPPDSHAYRVMFEPCSPAWVTQPPMICSTEPGSMPARLTTSICAAARSSAGCSPDSHPLRLPIGVRTASTITGWDMASPCSSWGPRHAETGGGDDLALDFVDAAAERAHEGVAVVLLEPGGEHGVGGALGEVPGVAQDLEQQREGLDVHPG